MGHKRLNPRAGPQTSIVYRFGWYFAGLHSVTNRKVGGRSYGWARTLRRDSMRALVDLFLVHYSQLNSQNKTFDDHTEAPKCHGADE